MSKKGFEKFYRNAVRLADTERRRLNLPSKFCEIDDDGEEFVERLYDEKQTEQKAAEFILDNYIRPQSLLSIKEPSYIERGLYRAYALMENEPSQFPIVAEMTIGLYYEDGGCEFEFSVEWSKRSDLTLAFHIFAESFVAFAEFDDFFARLATLDHKTLSPDEFRRILHQHGFQRWNSPDDTDEGKLLTTGASD
jgi:hypothetical protein